MRIRKTLLYVVAGVLVGVLALASSATAGDHPPNFTCDATHLPTNGAVYWNFDISGGACILDDVSFTVSRNVTIDHGGIELRNNAHVSVAGNVSVDTGSLYVTTLRTFAASSLDVGGNITATTSEVSVEDHDPSLTSPVTLRVGGNFTSDHGYNIRLANDGYNPLAGTGQSIIEIDGHTNISRTQFSVELGAGTFGPISIQDTNATVDPVEVTANVVHGSVSLTGNTATANLVSYNQISGNLGCSGNNPPPSNQGHPNTVSGSETGQCAGL